MSCGCGGSCCQSGLGRNLDLSILGRNRGGLRGLGNVLAGSVLRVGFRYSCATCIFGGIPEPDEIRDTVQGCLSVTGDFTSVQTQVSEGSILQNYLTVIVTLSKDFGQAEDVGKAIQDQIKSCYPDLGNLIDQRDRTLIDAVPQGTPIPTRQTTPNESGADPNRPDQCLIDPKTGKERQGLDYLNCKLGLGTSSGLSTLIIPIIAAVVIAKAFK